ncbi:MAG: hypothetical protein ABH811_01290 [archaeon]
MRKKKQYRDDEIQKARKVVREFGNICIRDMPYFTQLGLVKNFYHSIYGKKLEEISPEQLYRVAENLYNRSINISNKPTSKEKIILGNLSKLKNEKNPEKRYSLEERITIQLESGKFPIDGYLQKAYERAVNSHH